MCECVCVWEWKVRITAKIDQGKLHTHECLWISIPIPIPKIENGSSLFPFQLIAFAVFDFFEHVIPAIYDEQTELCSFLQCEGDEMKNSYLSWAGRTHTHTTEYVSIYSISMGGFGCSFIQI